MMLKKKRKKIGVLLASETNLFLYFVSTIKEPSNSDSFRLVVANNTNFT